MKDRYTKKLFNIDLILGISGMGFMIAGMAGLLSGFGSSQSAIVCVLLSVGCYVILWVTFVLTTKKSKKTASLLSEAVSREQSEGKSLQRKPTEVTIKKVSKVCFLVFYVGYQIFHLFSYGEVDWHLRDLWGRDSWRRDPWGVNTNVTPTPHSHK